MAPSGTDSYSSTKTQDSVDSNGDESHKTVTHDTQQTMTPTPMAPATETTHTDSSSTTNTNN